MWPDHLPGEIHGLPRHEIYADLSRQGVVIEIFHAGTQLARVLATPAEITVLIRELCAVMNALSEYEGGRDAIANGEVSATTATEIVAQA